MRPPALTHASAAIFLGDCLDVLAEMPDNSVDSIVTDPPYGLSKAPDMAEVLRHWLDGDDYVHTGSGFMGKTWDSFVPGPSVWKECLRVLKPGGHLLAFAGTRTVDLMGLAIRLAGFEMRDSIAWLYGSGFPKSMDVSKAVDKMRVEDREPTRVVCRAIRAAMDAEGLKSRDLVQHFEGCHPRLVDHWAARDTDSQPAMPKWEQWETLKRVLPALGADLDAEVWRLNGRKGTPGEAWTDRPVTGVVDEWKDRVNYALTSRDGLRRDIPATPAAQQWSGWGTALKPAFEPIVVARKPLSGTVAANVLEHGTGALNIDGCRVPATDTQLAEKYASVRNAPPRENAVYGTDSRPRSEGNLEPHAGGRWPTNVVLDGDAADELDEQSGVTRSSVRKPSGKDERGVPNTSSQMVMRRNDTEPRGVADAGGASRFFPTFRYQAKAPSRERPVVIHDDGTKTSHPTVKPLALMRWLVRLVTPAGGTVLDTFAGSGATIEAAVEEGFYAMGIEREEDYLQLIQVRLDRATTEETP